MFFPAEALAQRKRSAKASLPRPSGSSPKDVSLADWYVVVKKGPALSYLQVSARTITALLLIPQVPGNCSSLRLRADGSGPQISTPEDFCCVPRGKRPSATPASIEADCGCGCSLSV